MRKISTYAIVASMTFLAGCETMLAHHVMPSNNITSIAYGNAAVNACSSMGLISKQEAYNFSSVAANLLEISVVDETLYSQQHSKAAMMFSSQTQTQNEALCGQVRLALPELTARLSSSYQNISHSLGQARRAEIQSMTQSLNGMSNSFQQAPIHQNSWPAVKFKQETSPTNTYLINNNSGITQCRTTSKGYVFCI